MSWGTPGCQSSLVSKADPRFPKGPNREKEPGRGGLFFEIVLKSCVEATCFKFVVNTNRYLKTLPCDVMVFGPFDAKLLNVYMFCLMYLRNRPYSITIQ